MLSQKRRHFSGTHFVAVDDESVGAAFGMLRVVFKGNGATDKSR